MNKDRIPYRINSISELHHLLHLPNPKHPLLSMLDNCQMVIEQSFLGQSFSMEFYTIAYKASVDGKMDYGQGYYDFDEGGMMFTAPNQIIGTHNNTDYVGYSLFIHPDFIRNYPLGKTIKKYGFFTYATNEALHLSESEKNIILGLLRNIAAELNTSIDETSQDILVSYLEVLFNYSQRFYKRQFLTRKAVNHDLLSHMEQLLNDYFEKEEPLNNGLPTVEYLSEKLHLSPRYLSDMLRSLTGQNAQQHIHEKLIEKAKEYLSTTNLSVAEIAYLLGFERPQSFNKLFRKKLNQSPLAFRSLYS